MPRPELEELDGFARKAIRRRMQELMPKKPEAVAAAEPEEDEMTAEDKAALEQLYSQG